MNQLPPKLRQSQICTPKHTPSRVAFRLRNGVDTRDMNLCEAQWLAYVLPYRGFAAALTDDCARLGADVGRYSFIVSDLHQLLVAGLPAHCEGFCTLSKQGDLPAIKAIFRTTMQCSSSCPACAGVEASNGRAPH
jgi:hypothetical protein